MIKLTLLIPTLDRSGAEKQLALLAAGLPRTEFDVDVVTLDRAGPYEQMLREQGVPVTVLGKRARFDPGTWRRLRGQLNRRPPDVLHTWLFAANAYGRLAATRRPAMKIVVSERCVDSWKSRWQTWLDRRLISRTDRLVANSQSVADFYAQLGFPPERMTVIPNGVETPAAPTMTRAQLMASCELPEDARLVCYVGRLARQKRVDDLLWGAQVLRQADPRAHLLIIGDGPERDRLLQHARDVECTAHVRFLGHRADAAQIMQVCDVFWLASDFEGMSNSLLEAMACGLPSVVSNIPPNRELITHGVHGYLVDPGDGAGFAQFTLRLFQQPELSRTLGTAARSRIQQEFSVETMVERHAALYRSLLSGEA